MASSSRGRLGGKQITADSISSALNGTATKRAEGLDDLKSWILQKSQGSNQPLLGNKDKAYRKLLSDLFKCAVAEKEAYLSSKKNALQKAKSAKTLNKTAEALRLLVVNGISGIQRRTAETIIDHVTEILPGPDKTFTTPLLQDYMKSLVVLVSHPPNVEIFGAENGDYWKKCVDFFLEAIEHSLQGTEGEQISAARSSPAPGAGMSMSLPYSTARSGSASTQRSVLAAQSLSYRSLDDPIEGLHHLVSSSNVPLLKIGKEDDEPRARLISTTIIRILQLKALSLGKLQRACFAILNCIVSQVQGDDLELARSIVGDIMPLISHWWAPRISAQSESINLLREEILKTLYGMQLHLVSILRKSPGGPILSHVEDVLDALWMEYPKRDDRARLQLADVVFSSTSDDNFNTGTFCIRPHDAEPEGRWATVEVMSLLEAIHLGASRGQASDMPAGDEQPRKKRRIEEAPDRMRDRLRSLDLTTKLTALQILPFLFRRCGLTLDDTQKILPELLVLLTDKRPNIVSWAMVACSSIAIQTNSKDPTVATIWQQVWQLAVRAISLPGTSRAACALLYAILDSRLIPQHLVTDDIATIVTAADTSGPVILADSSLMLMLKVLHLRNKSMPNANQSTSNHIIRWVFSRWKPADPGIISSYWIHTTPVDMVNLLKASFGASSMAQSYNRPSFGGPLRRAWIAFRETEEMMRYLLLLDGTDNDASGNSAQATAPLSLESVQFTDQASANSAKKLILELISPILEEFTSVSETWTQRSGDSGSPINHERMQNLTTLFLVGTILTPHLNTVNSTQSRDLETTIFSLVDATFSTILDKEEDSHYIDMCLASVANYVPAITTSELDRLCRDSPVLLKYFSRLSALFEGWKSRKAAGGHDDLMDLDDEFGSQVSQGSSATKPTAAPRTDTSLSVQAEAFYLDVSLRLCLLAAAQEDRGQTAHVPATLVDALEALPDEEFLLCRDLLRDLLRSDLLLTPGQALQILTKACDVLEDRAYRSCETAFGMCFDLIVGLSKVWSDEELEADEKLSEVKQRVGELYSQTVQVALPNNLLSSKASISFSKLLYHLLEVNDLYGRSLGLESCRSILLSMLEKGDSTVKFFIGTNLFKIFGFTILSTHTGIIEDIINHLPQSTTVEETAMRLYALGGMACHWPTLLRWCIYWIFDTAGDVDNALHFAHRCLTNVAQALSLESPQVLWAMFSPQLLYTRLARIDPDTDQIVPARESLESIPFGIFGFGNLNELLMQAKSEVTALLYMRGQEDEVQHLAQRLHEPTVTLIESSFSKVMSYCIAYDISISNKSQPQHVTSESKLRKSMGKELFYDSTYNNFVDIVATLINLVDQEDPVDKYFARNPDFEYAATIMGKIKKLSHSAVELPPNQQPMFRAKFLAQELKQLCDKTEHKVGNLWNAALVVRVARSLLNTIHPAMGPLHACSVLRKIRILICLAGERAVTSYPLEMLLHCIRPFVQDTECADDALGMLQYLIDRGDSHLQQSPSFYAGFSLSMLASLRMFLESSQASTTQESQFKATKSNAQRFHSWFANRLAGYDSPAFETESQRQAFKLITQSAAQIRASGNAEKGTHESTLLLEILKDGEQEARLLNDSARDVALGMLCGDFTIPTKNQTDIIERDQDALDHNAVVWKSCEAQTFTNEYLVWAGRVVGKAFAASGEIHEDILRESSLSRYRNIASEDNSSEQGILSLLENLTKDKDCTTAGLAEAALRTIVSVAKHAGPENGLLYACQLSLSEHLLNSSIWEPYNTPPSDYSKAKEALSVNVYAASQIDHATFSQQLAVHLAQSYQDDILLAVLSPLLKKVKGFAKKAFPFIVHLVLLFQLDKNQSVKGSLSEAARSWLSTESPEARENLTLLINTFLYLRTQPIPGETSIADRSKWLDINHSLASAAASRCGMFRVGLLFAELAVHEAPRPSRRSSNIRDVELPESADLLLSIFENIDDPDAYYGVPQASSLSNVLSRLEYEKDGVKSLAFRGAQYDSHLRRKDPTAEQDGRSLVQVLGNLGLFGLSHSLLQGQQTLDETPQSLDSTFTTARRLGLWNLPAPTTSDSHAVNIYKAYQSIHQAADFGTAQMAVHEGLGTTMKYLTNHTLNASSMRDHLGALAALTELDEVMNAVDMTDLECVLARFEARSGWMRSGRYDDVSRVLSCRESTLRMIVQQGHLQASLKILPVEAQLTEIRGMLLSSGIHRLHNATQASLNVSTALTDLIPQSEALGLTVDAAIRMEAANSLWDHGEMIPSIRLLQSIHQDSVLKKQAVPVSRADLLSKIGYQASVARLETPGNIKKTYLEQALKELKGQTQGKDAGMVFHQFATFCDQQLQNSDGLEDLARLQSLKQGKSDEVAQWKTLIASEKNTQMKNRHMTHLQKAKLWLDMDQQELRRVEQTRSEFVKLSLENYLLSLMASDDHNNNALRFTALWLERSLDPIANDAVRHYLPKVATRKFAPLMNQLTSRLQEEQSIFQASLQSLVYRICLDHPYHGMYQIWAGSKHRANKDDEIAARRHKATERIAAKLSKDPKVQVIWAAIDKTSRSYHALAAERDPTRFKGGGKIAIKDTTHGPPLQQAFVRHKIPPPTMQMELAADMDYSKVPTIAKLDSTMTIASGVSAPKIIKVIATDGLTYRQLVKGGNDELRQDAIMEQVFAAVSQLLKMHRPSRQRNLGIRTYKVLPLTSQSGIIEFVPNTIPLHEYLMPAHERYYPKDYRGSQCRKAISDVVSKPAETRISAYRKITEKFHPVMRYFFLESFPDPDEWYTKRLAYTRTTAAISMLGHVLGLGDRHGHNILLDSKTGEVVHIDLGVAFESGRVLPVPEVVPFRLTRDIVDGMGITKTEGVFRRCCEFTLDAMREETYSIMTILDVLKHDPLHSWSMSAVRMAKLQEGARRGDDTEADDQGEAIPRKVVNEPSEAERALEVVMKKLSKTLSVTATVNDLINQATDERNLAVLYSGWAAYA